LKKEASICTRECSFISHAYWLQRGNACPALEDSCFCHILAGFKQANACPCTIPLGCSLSDR
jgi:hypothetical protein